MARTSKPITPPHRSPIDIFLGALNMVALPLVRGDAGDEMRETAQFYGYEDFGDHFKNVSPRITELVAHAPAPHEPGCVIELSTPHFLLPGAFTRAANRWAKSQRLRRDGPHSWCGNGLMLTLETLPSQNGKRAIRAVLRAVAP